MDGGTKIVRNLPLPPIDYRTSENLTSLRKRFDSSIAYSFLGEIPAPMIQNASLYRAVCPSDLGCSHPKGLA
jgi:hypothetical protein